MVLKVVRSKILETWELGRARLPAVPSWNGALEMQRSNSAGERCRNRSTLFRLSKIDDYLADNFCVPILSEMMDRVQEESERGAELVPTWESRPPSPPCAERLSGQSSRNLIGHLGCSLLECPQFRLFR